MIAWPEFAPGDAGEVRTQHNTFIQLLSELGIPALLLFVGALGAAVLGMRRASQAGVVAAAVRARHPVRPGRLRHLLHLGRHRLHLAGLSPARPGVRRAPHLDAPSFQPVARHRRHGRVADAAAGAGAGGALAMCGIYGFVAAAGDLGDPERVGATLDAMDRSIIHRGPDDNGQYFDERCAMGMRRLVDHRSRRRPAADANEDRPLLDRLQRRDLQLPRAARASCIARGHRFRTTQRHRSHRPPLRGVRRRAVVDALRGMFGFAIWDRARQRSCSLARDRFGIKPLYYAPTPARPRVRAPSSSRSSRIPACAALDLARSASRTTSRFGSTPRRSVIFERRRASCRPATSCAIATARVDVDALLGSQRRPTTRAVDEREAAPRCARARARRRRRVAPRRRRPGRRLPLRRHRLERRRRR